ncbi:MAG: sigma-70 family RNA polymerase sigma factor [Acidobacteria bacterium]|nr:sigma-70 family RNA polymerase sigma factor [Acidobacteriota bacterium]
MPTGNDERLIREILAGDADRFEEIVRSYQNRIAGLAFRMGVRFDDMEDVTVEIMTKTFRNLHLYRPDYAFSTWIYRVAINHIRDHHRRRRRDAGLEPISEHLPATGTDALQAAGEDQRRREIRIALARLPERYRTAMILMHLEEKSLAEIAAILNLPVGTIKSRLSRGRERLRQILIREFPHLGEK